jgi:hypothetical protein
MTDQPLSQDELASAVLDGEPTGPRPVEPSSEAVAARVEELRRAADAIGQPVVADDAARERAIAAALQAFDEPAPITAHRSRFMPALAAVAAAVLVLVGVVAVVRHDSSTPAETASQLEAASGATAAPTTMAAFASNENASASLRGPTNDASSQAGGATAPAAPAPSARDLGDLSDPDALRAAIGPEAFMTKAAQLAPTPTACEPEARAGAATDLGTLTDDVTLHWKGQAARALVFVDAASASHIVVVADPSCAVLDLIN